MWHHSHRLEAREYIALLDKTANSNLMLSATALFDISAISCKQKEITEQGQLLKSREYQKRIEAYQKLHGITIEEKKEENIELAPGFQMPNKGKYYRKKLYRKKKKMKEKQALLEVQKQENGENAKEEQEEEVPNGKTEEKTQVEEPVQVGEQDK